MVVMLAFRSGWRTVKSRAIKGGATVERPEAEPRTNDVAASRWSGTVRWPTRARGDVLGRVIAGRPCWAAGSFVVGSSGLCGRGVLAFVDGR